MCIEYIYRGNLVDVVLERIEGLRIYVRGGRCFIIDI